MQDNDLLIEEDEVSDVVYEPSNMSVIKVVDGKYTLNVERANEIKQILGSGTNNQFTLYAAGESLSVSSDYKKVIGYAQLLSQLNERGAIKKWVSYLREHPECTCKLFIDSGAFTAYTKGKEVDVDDYINFINENDDQFTVYAQVDKIPGRWGVPQTQEELRDAPRQSWENYLYMVDKVKSPKKLIPIFHQGEDFKWLKNMLEYRYPDGSYIDYIGISCNKELSSNVWISWFEQCFQIIKASNNPNVKTHAFGMTSLRVCEQFPFTSSDSTTWIRTSSFGTIIMDGGKTVVTSDMQLNSPLHYNNLSSALKEGIRSKCASLGWNIDDIVNDPKAVSRALWNLTYLKNWELNYQYKGSIAVTEDLW